MNTPPTLQEAAVFENFSDPPIIKPPVYPEAVLHHAADTLEESEASYRCLFEFNPHPMWIYDRETFRFLLSSRPVNVRRNFPCADLAEVVEITNIQRLAA